MYLSMNHRTKSIARMSVYLLLLLSLSASCSLKKFGRSYSQQLFDSNKWRDGDAIERGTMVRDLYGRRILNDKTKKEVFILLGAPDGKTSNEGFEVWLYIVETRGENPRHHFPVLFGKDGKASSGEKRREYRK